MVSVVKYSRAGLHQKRQTNNDKSVPSTGTCFIDGGMFYYRPPEGGRLYDKVVSGYAFLRTYFV